MTEGKTALAKLHYDRLFFREVVTRRFQLGLHSFGPFGGREVRKWQLFIRRREISSFRDVVGLLSPSFFVITTTQGSQIKGEGKVLTKFPLFPRRSLSRSFKTSQLVITASFLIEPALLVSPSLSLDIP